MKVRTIKIENYKSHKYKEILFQDFNILIGENGAGKTAILEIFDLIKFPGSEIGDIEEKVFGGINDNETKTVNFILEIELSYDERKKYIHRFFLNNFSATYNKAKIFKELRKPKSITELGKPESPLQKEITSQDLCSKYEPYFQIVENISRIPQPKIPGEILGNILNNR